MNSGPDATRPPPPAAAQAPTRAPEAGRAHGLDALRGLAILLMCLSGLVPGALPNWMYHGYHPTHLPATLQAAAEADGGGNGMAAVDRQPDRWEPVEQKRFRPDWPGLTWVDAVFPMFLFAMGAAIPLAVAARTRRGDSSGKLVRGAFLRFGLLVAFAVYVQRATPYFMENPPTAATWGLALLAMVPVGLVLTRLPRGWPAWTRWATRLAGWTSAIAFVAYTTQRAERPFDWTQKDIIILLLAWSSLLVTLGYLATRRAAWARLLLLGPVVLLAHHQAMRPGWRVFGDRLDGFTAWLQMPKAWLDLSGLGTWIGAGPLLPAPPGAWLNFAPLYDFTWFKVAGIVVLGTLIGDVILRRQGRLAEAGPASSSATGAGRAGAWLLTLLLIASVVGTLAGLKDYATVFVGIGPLTLSTPFAAILLGVLPAWLAVGLAARIPASPADRRYLCTLSLWGAGALTAGTLLAAMPGPPLDTRFAFFEGGIKKGPPATLSWYLVSFGLSVLTLAALALWLDVRGRSRAGAWLIANGQNPMLAYMGIRNLLAPLMALPLVGGWVTGGGAQSVNAFMLGQVFGGGPWRAAAWAALQTLGLALAVWLLTRRRIVWRS